LDLLKDLNEDQRRAVELADGKVLVLAGAGSGKTRVLVHRIAWALERGLASPDEIVAVTFTNKAAAEMKDRVARLLAAGEAPDRVGTFHSICLRMLRREAPRLGYRAGFQVFDTDDSLRLIKDGLKEARLDSQAASPGEILRRISSAKNAGIDPAESEQFWRGPMGEVYAAAYQSYQSGLRRMNAMDFDDLIVNALTLFQKHPDRAALWSGSCRYLLVDEYQDTNRPQYLLVRALSEVHGNLCVVGDEDQSIYRFRGADIGNILSFQKDFPDAELVKLTRNYRSTGSILSASNSLVRNNTERIGKDLWTDAGRGDAVRFVRLPGDREEASFVTRLMQEWRASALLEVAAILYRTNAQSRLFEESLIGAGIPYRIFGSLRFYDRKEIRDLMAYLKLAVNPADDISFKRAVNVPPRGIGAAAMLSIESLAARAGKSLHDALAEALAAGTVPARAAARASEFMTILAEMREKIAAPSGGDAPGEIVRFLVKRIDYDEYLHRTEESEAESRLENVSQLIDAAREAGGPEGLQGFLDRASLVSDAESVAGERGVNLMTLHSAKGLEFDLVCLVGLEEGLCPHARTLESESEIEEERRLAYVGMTRARKRLYLTAAETRRTFGETAPAKLSRFISEIGEENLEVTRPFAAAAWSESRSSGARTHNSGTRHVPLGDEDVSRHTEEDDGCPDSGNGAFDFPVGARVRHDQFGIGEVVVVEPADGGQKLTIRFGGRSRKLLTRFARLTRIGS